jgi:NAD(P)-dependent dehydrogenase (short-subunit alcohol dehydrogenase family)
VTRLTSFEEVGRDTGYHGCELRIVDLCDFASVVAFADKFEKEVDDLHILVMNAGTLQPKYQPTTDGWESMFVYRQFTARVYCWYLAFRLQVNHLATSLLSLLLIPQLVSTGRKSSTPSRMVIVSSDVHYWANPTEEVKASAKPLKKLSNQEWFDPK